MKDKIYNYAPVVLLITGLILLLGMFCIDKYIFNHSFSWVRILLIIILILLCTFCGVIIRNLYLQVHTDTLTGLHNRKYFYTKLAEIKIKKFFSLILIDLDDFKNVNDTYGHLAGDQVLQQFAEILNKNTRKNDIIARWGGEEFALILPETGLQEAFKIADRIRTVVEGYVFSCKKNTCKITISIGIAATKEGTDLGIEQFVKIADEALYRAKEKKNSIVMV
ncbi:MAG: GGDEF domain-containing protein [Peptococcia bacterium]|jgi:diguanylate cyclase